MAEVRRCGSRAFLVLCGMERCIWRVFRWLAFRRAGVRHEELGRFGCVIVDLKDFLVFWVVLCKLVSVPVIIHFV